eukprot:CAMPEP_0197660994 /NCGR_PEP_ID=MMETSP1338-20131121/51183_1 /TAXON_ID=43686 ORGANISM="Pelagodinium beii, Strain RCC1491" /NCGR_SAMPLE_ID=MMETSP1338 /ASSEMBLY_ACC=CAM_ASM_000754 /LENGTH=525 /DNA_ID=CAMNT_0043238459 /DNA_START=1 /DNA_END=1578 /DNA_ORIENTATION=-
MGYALGLCLAIVLVVSHGTQCWEYTCGTGLVKKTAALNGVDASETACCISVSTCMDPSAMTTKSFLVSQQDGVNYSLEIESHASQQLPCCGSVSIGVFDGALTSPDGTTQWYKGGATWNCQRQSIVKLHCASESAAQVSEASCLYTFEVADPACCGTTTLSVPVSLSTSNSSYAVPLGSSYAVPLVAAVAAGSVLCMLLSVWWACKARHAPKKTDLPLPAMMCHNHEAGNAAHLEDVTNAPLPGLLGHTRLQSVRPGASKARSPSLGISADYLAHRFTKEVEGLGLTHNSALTFHDLCPHFAKGPNGKGFGKVCPRDGDMGCSIVDALEEPYKGKVTHFVSWCWSYVVADVANAIECWLRRTEIKPEEVFLWMCFFCNNQYRIGNGAPTTPEYLMTAFQSNLVQAGEMLLLLDTFVNPIYVTRAWCVFEAFICIDKELPMTVVMPQAADDSFQQILASGVDNLRTSLDLRNLDVRTSSASSKQDEDMIKSLILSSHGFDAVNRLVKQGLAQWLATSFSRTYVNVD